MSGHTVCDTKCRMKGLGHRIWATQAPDWFLLHPAFPLGGMIAFDFNTAVVLLEPMRLYRFWLWALEAACMPMHNLVDSIHL